LLPYCALRRKLLQHLPTGSTVGRYSRRRQSRSSSPSGDQSMQRITGLFPTPNRDRWSSDLTTSPVSIFHTQTIPSESPAARYFPSGDQAILPTGASRGEKVWRISQFLADQIRTVKSSSDPDASLDPSGDHAGLEILAWWPRSVAASAIPS
jgi:hypothetical protein